MRVEGGRRRGSRWGREDLGGEVNDVVKVERRCGRLRELMVVDGSETDGTFEGSLLLA